MTCQGGVQVIEIGRRHNGLVAKYGNKGLIHSPAIGIENEQMKDDSESRSI